MYKQASNSIGIAMEVRIYQFVIFVIDLWFNSYVWILVKSGIIQEVVRIILEKILV